MGRRLQVPHDIQPPTRLLESLQPAACFHLTIVTVRPGREARAGDTILGHDGCNGIVLELFRFAITSLVNICGYVFLMQIGVI